MKFNRKKDHNENYFGSLPTVHIYSKFKDGKFYDIESGKEVILSNGSFVRMITLLANIKDDEYPKFEEQREEVLPIDSILYMRLPLNNGEGEYRLVIKLKEPLFMKKIGNKASIVEPCKCEIIDRIEFGSYLHSIKFEPFEADSLNQAFFQASVRYRPKNKSHSANIYQCCFLENGNNLSSLRF